MLSTQLSYGIDIVLNSKKWCAIIPIKTNSRKLLLTTRRWHTNTLNSNPLGVYDIASYARNYGYKVDVYYIDKIPLTNKYDIIGLSVFESENNFVFEDIRFLQSAFPQTKLVVGGRWTKHIDEETKHWFMQNDVELWTEEGEKYFNQNQEIDYENYPGWYKKDLLTTHANGRNVMSSRGCPFHCYFCHNPEKQIFNFNSRYTADNIQLLLEQNVNEIFFVDDIFTLKESHMLDIYYDLKKRYLNILGRNLFFTHVNLVNESKAEVMKKFKPSEVQIGLESGDDRMLSLIGKSFNTNKAYEKVKLLSNFVPVNGLFLIGYPGETLESLNNTLSFVQNLNPFLSKKWVSLYQPIKNTVGYFKSLTEGKFYGELTNNSTVHYVPEGLLAEDLLRYRDLIMQT
ncbi:MAG: Fe-S oxidoreductase [Ignavibacteria bacterium]|nr:MAG: Fe-S oxidoreductase [Ignavibacteria bacterium]KAF0160166.1 MAG: Fe-S oxidoreductase [Ignavibacteria bacterium]